MIIRETTPSHFGVGLALLGFWCRAAGLPERRPGAGAKNLRHPVRAGPPSGGMGRGVWFGPNQGPERTIRGGKPIIYANGPAKVGAEASRVFAFFIHDTRAGPLYGLYLVAGAFGTPTNGRRGHGHRLATGGDGQGLYIEVLWRRQLGWSAVRGGATSFVGENIAPSLPGAPPYVQEW